MVGWAMYGAAVLLATWLWDVSSLYRRSQPIWWAVAWKSYRWSVVAYRGGLIVVVIFTFTAAWRLSGVWWGGLIGFITSWYIVTRLMIRPALAWYWRFPGRGNDFYQLRWIPISLAYILMQAADIFGSAAHAR